jgi:hypothetical protein
MVKPGRDHARAEMLRVVVEPGAQLVAVLDQVERAQRRRRNDGRHAVREEVRPRSLAQPADDLAARRRESAGSTAQRLAERACDDVDAANDVAKLRRPASVRADEPAGVRIVDHDQRAVAIGQIADLPEPRDDAVHREYAVGDDQAGACIRRFLEPGLELVEVVVGVAQPARLAEPDTVDDARVVQCIADDRVVLIDDRLEEPAVGVETRRIEDRVLETGKRAEPGLEFLVHRLCSADEAHRGHAVAVAIQCPMRGLAQRRVIGQAEIVVRAQVDDLAAILQAHNGLLRGRQHAFRLEEPLAPQVGRLAVEPLEKVAIQVPGSCGLQSAKL